ncbi:MAG: hypothetical protein C0601_10100 [Candidatus Muiribacterium halophilum]|uniref:Heavy-metal chelation domain-containing protein n=1 Tax=Muiribacterium halophilum TaxID=2053465 RepID=A0A2N5ZCT5_MUIH1|nr:MAG: hypothetical protein C0601_10100 [Candidatus Muirbacterium halophilum]
MDKSVYKRLINEIDDKEIIIKDIFLFLNNVVVKSRNIGVAGTCKELPINSSKRKLFPKLSYFKNKTVEEIFDSLIDTENIIERSVLLAVINSCISIPEKYTEENSISIARRSFKEDSKISFIGHFPAADRLRKEGFDVNIIELEPKEGDIYYYESDHVLKNTDILFITGLTIINGTFNDILKKTKEDCIRVLMGPSVPLSPVFLELGIHIVGGSIVKDEEKMMEFWQCGGAGMRRAPKGALKVASLIDHQML